MEHPECRVAGKHITHSNRSPSPRGTSIESLFLSSKIGLIQDVFITRFGPDGINVKQAPVPNTALCLQLSFASSGVCPPCVGAAPRCILAQHTNSLHHDRYVRAVW